MVEVINTELIPTPNTEKTCKRVSKFFHHDLERLVLMSGHSITDLQSPKFDTLPGGQGGTFNSQENKILNALDAELIVKSVYDAINHMDDVSHKIIMGLYIKHQRWVDVQSVLFREHTTFAKLRKQALINFAALFETWQGRNNCNKQISLKVYD